MHMRCDPVDCPFCQYIGDGDSYCEEIGEVVLADWEPTNHFKGKGCPYVARRNKRRKNAETKKKSGIGMALKYMILILIGVWLYWLGAAYGYRQRGYSALGGEVFALFLPVLYWIVSGTIREIVKSLKWW